MSDDDNYSNSDSENNDSENEDIIISKKKNISLFKPNVSIKAVNTNLEDELYELDDAENEDEEDEEEDEEDDDDEEPEQEGGAITEEDDETESENEDESDIELDENGEPIEKELNVKSSKILKNSKSKKPNIIIEDDDDDDDDDYDDNYLQKFDSEIIKNYVNEFHPECLNHNYEEISQLSIIIKNLNGIIVDPLHKTIPYLTKYEKARILGQRAKQIENGSKPFVKVTENIIDSYIIAELELKEKKIPFIIRRPIPGGGSEYWKLKDLEIISF